MNLTGRSLAAYRKHLMEWYGRNKRAMPWRGTRDAYRVWVSEIMLQQTRVAAVLPYCRRFLKKFPTVQALARARSEEVLKQWAGLGYYSRAQNLHRAAKEIVAKHGGKFPREYEAALALPGVGRYAAAAVLSIAYGEPLAVVDGNVARVVARLGAVRGELRETGRWRKLESKAQELLGAEKTKIEKRKTKNGKTTEQRKAKFENRKTAHTNRNDEIRKAQIEKREKNLTSVPTKTVGTGRELQAGEWNQAMMELGATVCTPRAPRCGECPVARWCDARKMGLVEKIPAARTKRETERMEIAAAVLLDPRGRTLLVKPENAGMNGLSPENAATNRLSPENAATYRLSPENAATNRLFSRMWQFPAVEVRKDARAELRRYLSGMPRGEQKQNHLEPQMNADKRRYETRREKDLTQGKQRSTEGTERLGKGRGFVALETVKHSVTFREMTLRPFLMRVRELPAVADGARIVSLARVNGLAVSSATRKIARGAQQHIAR